ncbi:MAG: sugar ABC transporter permease [Acidimicrobiia bacterium]|nr:sugar ABC transporter permease [Acidimicrobiia bacterium]
MTTAEQTISTDATGPTGGHPPWLIAVIAWQAVVAVVAIVAAVGLATGVLFDFSGVGLVVTVTLTLGVAAAAVYAIPHLLAHRNRGRSVATLLQYTILVLGLIAAIQEMGLFRGIDALASSYRDAWYWTLLVVLGWIIYSQAERIKSAEKAIQRVGRYTMAGGAIILTIAVGVIPGTIEFARRLLDPEVIGLTVFAVVSGVMFFLLRRSAATDLFETTVDEAEAIDGFLFVSPNVFGFLAFFAFPLVFSLFVSFTAWDGLTEITWLGPDNYIKIFSLQFASVEAGQAASDVLSEGYSQAFRFGDVIMGARDPNFWIGMRNILVFAFVAIPLATFPALVLAALLNSKIPGMKVFRAIYFIPYVAGILGVLLIWKQLYNASIGFINYGILRVFDFINAIFGTEFVAPQPEWLSDPNIAMWSIVIFFAWFMTGYNAVLFVAGMQGIPGSLYEAADIDGASWWKKFRNITVPLLRPTTFFVVSTTTILGLQVFTEPFVLMGPQLPPSGPGNATLTPVVQLYQEGFQRFNQGYASALAWVLFVLIFAVTILNFWRQRRLEGEGVG